MTKPEQLLTKGLSGLAHPVGLEEEQLRQLRVFFENLTEWNKVMNLTAITEEEDVYVKHFLDSLSILEVMDRAELGKYRKVIDVGTGAGFPGLVLAIAFPELQVTLMDSLNKRISFLNDTIQKTGISNVVTIHARAEELAHDKNHREKYGMAVSRAVANLATLCEYDLPFIKTGGIFVAYKSEKAAEELGEPHVMGLYRSHDSFYMESKSAHEGLWERMEKWKDANAVSEENESGTLFPLGYLLGIRAATICVVLGYMLSDADPGNYPAYTKPFFLEERIHAETKVVLKAIDNLAKEGRL